MRKLRMAILIGATLLPGAGYALDAHEAQAVVRVLEQLTEARGESVYMDAAADWLEFDAETDGLIAAAGFSPQQWIRAYDETLLGYAGGISEAEIDAQIAHAEASLAASSLTPEQKAMVLDDFLGQMAEVRRVSREGRAYAPIIAPLRGRLHALMEGF